jgi:hypothetical protein
MRFQQSEVQTLKPKIESKAIEELQILKNCKRLSSYIMHREGGTSGVKP